MKILYLSIVLLLCTNLTFAQDSGNFRDPRDGKNYEYVRIGDHVWMTDNMAYEAETGSWIYKGRNDSITGMNRIFFGRLYDWEAAKEACPSGWHLPSRGEWNELFDYLGGTSVAGGKMKATGDNWAGSNKDATNESGFTALPGGWRTEDGKFQLKNNYGYWWTSSEHNKFLAHRIELAYKAGWVNPKTSDKKMAHSVRCIKD